MSPERILKALANQRRLAIMSLLKKRELSVMEIAKQIDLSVKATSKHLQILIKANILLRRQKSLIVFYRLSDYPHPIVKTTLSIL